MVCKIYSFTLWFIKCKYAQKKINNCKKSRKNVHFRRKRGKFVIVFNFYKKYKQKEYGADLYSFCL